MFLNIAAKLNIFENKCKIFLLFSTNFLNLRMKTIENQYITARGKRLKKSAFKPLLPPKEQPKEPPLPPRVKSLKELLEEAVSELERKSAK